MTRSSATDTCIKIFLVRRVLKNASSMLIPAGAWYAMESSSRSHPSSWAASILDTSLSACSDPAPESKALQLSADTKSSESDELHRSLD